MKPLKLTIEGINSFIEPQTLDFEAAGRNDLFCISGKTGAGKTTVFDSIMLALYGKSAKGNLADVVNLSLTSARVELDFFENGELYKVERTIKCRYEKDENGGKTDKRIAVSDCMLYKNGAPFAKGEDATAKLAEIVGLEAAEFKNVYLLEQGQYAEFLKKTPSKQTEAVGKIFSLMRFGDVSKLAGEREREQLHLIDIKQAEIARLGDASPQKLREQKDELKALRAKTTALMRDAERAAAELSETEKIRDEFIRSRQKQEAVKKLMLQYDEAKKREYEAKKALEDFERTVDPADKARRQQLGDELNRLSALNTLDREYAAAMTEIKNKQASLDGRRAQLTQTEQLVKSLGETAQADRAALAMGVEDFTRLANAVTDKSAELVAAIEAMTIDAGLADIVEAKQRLKAELDRYGELVSSKNKVRSQIAELKDVAKLKLGEIERYERGLIELRERLQAAESEAEQKAEALTAAQVGSHAAAVRAELHDGDICPVCGGRYDGSHVSADTDVDKAKAELERAKANLKSVQIERDECVKHCDRAKSEYEGFDRSVKEREEEERLIDCKIAQTSVDPETYKALISALDGCRTAAERAERSNAALDKKTPALVSLQAECGALSDSLAELRAKADDYRMRLGDACGLTASEIEKVKTELAALDKKLDELDRAYKKLDGEAKSAAATVEAINTALEAAKADCPVDCPEFDETAYAEKRDALDRLKKTIAENEREIAVKDVEIAALAKQCDDAAALAKELAAVKKRADLYKTVADMTKGKAMLNFVAAEYIAEFTAVASDILNELSSGKYTMNYDKENGFTVSDYLNGGKSRKTDTLSGGELFLASLSVAIAIASTQGGGNNAFFFLDEGFGTLDEDLIDVVYAALQSLAKDRLVGVITHADALIARMPYCVTVVEATDSCGSKIIA